MGRNIFPVEVIVRLKSVTSVADSLPMPLFTTIRRVTGSQQCDPVTRQVTKMLERYDEQKLTVEEICKIHGISRPSFYNYLNKSKKAIQAA